MNWKNTLTQMFKKPPEAKASKAAPLLVQFGVHQPRFTPRHYDRLAAEGYQKNVIAYRCIRLISQNAAAVPWQVYKGSGKNKIRLEDHPLFTLLQRPNPVQGGAELFEALFGFFLIAGNSYLETVGPNQGPPRELWALRPDRMRVIPGTDGVPEVYRYTINGRAID